MALPPFISERNGTAEVEVRVTPRASRAGVAGARAGALVVRVSSPPAEGRANAAVRNLIAKACGVPGGAVTIIRGEHSREKLLRVEGMSAIEAARRLAG